MKEYFHHSHTTFKGTRISISFHWSLAYPPPQNLLISFIPGSLHFMFSSFSSPLSHHSYSCLLFSFWRKKKNTCKFLILYLIIYTGAFSYLGFDIWQHLCLPAAMWPKTAYKSVSKKDTYLPKRCLVVRKRNTFPTLQLLQGWDRGC